MFWHLGRNQWNHMPDSMIETILSYRIFLIKTYIWWNLWMSVLTFTLYDSQIVKRILDLSFRSISAVCNPLWFMASFQYGHRLPFTFIIGNEVITWLYMYFLCSFLKIWWKTFLKSEDIVRNNTQVNGKI